MKQKHRSGGVQELERGADDAKQEQPAAAADDRHRRQCVSGIVLLRREISDRGR